MDLSGILIVDDDEMVQEVLSRPLAEQGYDVRVASDGRQAWDMIRKKGFDVLITDLDMPEMTGQELIEKVKGYSPATVVIVLTGHGSLDSARDAIHAGCDEYLLKPLEDVNEIKLVVKRCLEKHRLLMEAIAYKQMIRKAADECAGPAARKLLNAIDCLIRSLKEKDTGQMLAFAEEAKNEIEYIITVVEELSETLEGLKEAENKGGLKHG